MRNLTRFPLAALTAATLAIGASGATVAAAPPSHSSAHASTVCGLDRVWLRSSIEGDRFEIRGGKIALLHSTQHDVVVLARRLVKDHTKSRQEAVALARKLGVGVPSQPSPSQQWELRELKESWGATFNHDYADLEVSDHRQDIQEAKDEVSHGCNSEVKNDARKEIPTLREHLRLAKRALAANQGQ